MIRVTLDIGTDQPLVLVGDRDEFEFKAKHEPIGAAYGGSFGGDADFINKVIPGPVEFEVTYGRTTYRPTRVTVEELP